jgi:hypothetical protein
MSTLKINTLSNLAGSQSTPVENAINGSAKAWANLDGGWSSTVGIRASFNVSSITETPTDTIQINFTTPMADNKYAVVVGGVVNANSFYDRWVSGWAETASQCRVRVANTSTSSDATHISVAVFR